MSLASDEIAARTSPALDGEATPPSEPGIEINRAHPHRRPGEVRRRRPAPRRRAAVGRSRARSIDTGGIVVGTLAGLNDDGEPLVRHPLDPCGTLTLARTTLPLTAEHVDREVVLGFDRGDVRRPIILGWLATPGGQPAAGAPASRPVEERPIVRATLDGEQLVLSADREIVLRCGEASLTLTRAGKVLIRGTYLLSRSSGVNRIKGGSVQLN